MTGEMVYAQFFILEMMRVFRRLELVQLGLLMRIVLENCLMQAPLDRRDDKLPKLLGCKTRKTFERHLDALIEANVVLETEDGIIADMAENAIEHFQKNSKDGKHGAKSRWERRKSSADPDDQHQEAVSAEKHTGDLPAAVGTREGGAWDEEDDSLNLPIDRLFDELHELAMRKGRPNLAEALNKFEAKHQVGAWFDLDLSPEKIIKKVAEVMNNKHDERISSWKYFDPPMRELARASGG